MKITVTNLGTVAVPLTSSQDKGYATAIEPGATVLFDAAPVTIAVVGTNPSFTEDLKEALGNVYDLAVKLILFWKAHPQPHDGGTHPVVSIRITADTPVRCTGDDKSLDVEIPAGSTRDVTMKDYVELRQLGLANDPQSGPEAP